jgi:hypothetical protein
MSLLGSFVFGRENDGLFGSRLLGRARMPVRGLASGRSWCLMRYDFAPFFAPISAFSRFLCIGFFGLFFFFSFFPLFSLDSSSFWCGCSVIDCIFDFSGLGIQQLIGFFGLLIVCVFGFLGFVLGMLAFGRLCVLGGGLLVQLGSGWVDRWFGGGSILG